LQEFGIQRSTAQTRKIMHVLILYVHPTLEGFCGQILTKVTTALSEAGHEVEVGDLYREGFNPALMPADYAQFSGQPMPPDVLREQTRIERNDALVVISPIWWYQFPAMLKGWIDRVFSEGWAFSDSLSRTAPPTLRLRNVLVIASAGGVPSTYEKYGYRQGIAALWDKGIWGYCGIEPITHFLWGIQPRQMSALDKERLAAEARDAVTRFVDGLL
jgi:NAD(P)H dehydrogenase (quinone)